MKFYPTSWLFTLLMFTQGFTYGITFVNNQYVPAEYVVLADQIIKEVSERMTKRYDLRVVGVTSGLMDSINVLGLRLQIQGPVSKERLREILVDCVEDFLTLLNGNQKIRPFLKEYPFTAKGIDVAVFVVDKRGTGAYYPEISVAGEYDGKIVYRSSEEGVLSGYKSSEEEDYETALKIVRGSPSQN